MSIYQRPSQGLNKLISEFMVKRRFSFIDFPVQQDVTCHMNKRTLNNFRKRV